jgi:hypothetical protein
MTELRKVEEKSQDTWGHASWLEKCPYAPLDYKGTSVHNYYYYWTLRQGLKTCSPLQYGLQTT